MPAPNLSKTTPAAVKNITRADIEKYLAIEDQRRELGRQMYLLTKQANAIEDKLEAYVLAKAPTKSRTIERSGYRLSIVEKAGAVSWKTAFVDVAGQAKADELVAAAPPRDELAIEKL
jgi:hypothetical protein